MATNLSSRLRREFTENGIVLRAPLLKSSLVEELAKISLLSRDGAGLSHTWEINATTSYRDLEALIFSRNGSAWVSQQYISMDGR